MGGSLLSAIHLVLALQVNPAIITGVVRDGESGAPIAGALVTLTDLDRSAITDVNGLYLLRGVPAGPQHLSIRSLGYLERTLHALVPRSGELVIHVALRVNPIRLGSVQVRARVAVRGLDEGERTAAPDRSVTIASVRNHPLLSEPDFFLASTGGEVIMRPEAPSGIHIRGGAADHTAYLLDGIPVFSPYHAAGVVSAWNPDALSQVDTWSAAPAPWLPDALAGTVSATTRSPGARLSARGSTSTTQTRVTIDGSIAAQEIGYLLSWRQGYPGILAPRNEASYIRGETSDWLAKLEAPTAGGRLRLLLYESSNELNAAAVPEATLDSPRNRFEWTSQSIGAEWQRRVSGLELRMRSWRVAAGSSSLWLADEPTALHLSASRLDYGLLAQLERRTAQKTTLAGVSGERIRTRYRTDDAMSAARDDDHSLTDVATVFAQHARRITSTVQLQVGGRLAHAAQSFHWSPRAQVGWTPLPGLAVSTSYARTYQWVQSLRNPESVTGTIFPADLHSAHGQAPATSEQVVVAADYLAAGSVRLGVQAYTRRFDGVLLVAPRTGDPFLRESAAAGAGRSRGISWSAALSGARYALLASYGWQQVRVEYGDSSYVPDHGVSHTLEAGITFFPVPSASLRLGLSAAAGRRTTPVTSGLEWESCNLLDVGCEFGGTPRHRVDQLGATSLPFYARVDLGARKHWHIRLAGRDASLGVFGTITNVLARRNVLTHARNPVTGELTRIPMRPLAPLAFGLDWQF